MTDKSIQMKKWNGSGWDNLHPYTKTGNVIDKNGVDLETNLSNVVGHFDSELTTIRNDLEESIELIEGDLEESIELIEVI